MVQKTAHHKIRVFVHGGKGRVEPGHLVVKPHDTLEFVTINTDASFFFPDPGVVAAVRKGVNPRFGDLKLKPAKTSAPMVFEVIKETGGVHPFAVFCAATNDFAEGHSSPMMIIDDPDP